MTPKQKCTCHFTPKTHLVQKRSSREVKNQGGQGWVEHFSFQPQAEPEHYNWDFEKSWSKKNHSIIILLLTLASPDQIVQATHLSLDSTQCYSIVVERVDMMACLLLNTQQLTLPLPTFCQLGQPGSAIFLFALLNS